MIRKTIPILAVLSAVLLLAACAPFSTVRGSGDIGNETRSLGPFTAVNHAGVGTVRIQPGDTPAIRVEAQQNLLPFIETNVEDNTLTITAREGVTLLPTQGIFYTITTPDLHSLRLSGLGDIRAPLLDSPAVELRISGSGNMIIDELRADYLEARLSGLGNLTIHDGAVGTQEVRLSGAGSYDSRDMSSSSADVQLSGLGSATVHATETLKAVISGAGNISYAGRPSVSSEINGLGQISALDG